jgi:hypothetical protein
MSRLSGDGMQRNRDFAPVLAAPPDPPVRGFDALDRFWNTG